MKRPAPPVSDRNSDEFKLRLYRHAVIALCKQNGGTLKIENFMDHTSDVQGGEKGTLMHRATPGGGWEFMYVPDKMGGNA